MASTFESDTDQALVALRKLFVAKLHLDDGHLAQPQHERVQPDRPNLLELDSLRLNDCLSFSIETSSNPAVQMPTQLLPLSTKTLFEKAALGWLVWNTFNKHKARNTQERTAASRARSKKSTSPREDLPALLWLVARGKDGGRKNFISRNGFEPWWKAVMMNTEGQAGVPAGFEGLQTLSLAFDWECTAEDLDLIMEGGFGTVEALIDDVGVRQTQTTDF